MSIREVERSGKRKNPRGGRKKKKKAREGRLRGGLKHYHGTIDPGAKLGAKIYGAKLGARIYGTKLGPRIYLLSHRHVCVEPKTSMPATMAPRSVSSALATMTSS